MSKKTGKHGAGYRVFHSVLCVIATLYLLFALVFTAVLLHYEKSDKLVEEISTVSLGETKIPFAKDTVAERIHADYVTDENISLSDMESAVNAMDIPAYAAEKADTLLDMFRGDYDAAVQIPVSEITDLLDSSQGSMLDNALILVDEQDKAALEAELSEPLGTCNRVLDTLYGSPALRAFARVRVSIFRIIFDGLLLVLLLIRWMQVFKNSGKAYRHGIKAMGITAVVPSAIVTAVCLYRLVASYFIKDNIKTLAPVEAVLRKPILLDNLLVLLVGILMILTAMLMKKVTNRHPQTSENGGLSDTMELDTSDLADEDEDDDEDDDDMPPETHCIYCKRTLKNGAKFCVYCGKSQTEPPTEE